MEEGMTLDIKEIFGIIRKRLWLVIIITIAAVVISGIASYFLIAPKYKAETSIIIGKAVDISAADQSQYNYNDVMMYQQLAKTYVQIAQSDTVAQKTADALENGMTPDAILKSVTVTSQDNTQIMTIDATAKTPEDAMKIANTLTDSFISEAAKLLPSGNVSVLDKASLPKSPVSPRPKLDMAIGLLLGIVISLGIIFLMEYMDTTIKTEDDIEKYLGLPVIGIIPKNQEN